MTYANIDCSLPDDPKVIEAGVLAELLYLRSVLWCREHLTDGVIDRRVLNRVAVGFPTGVKKHVDALVAVGLWEECEQGWRFPGNVWTRWNPSKQAIEDARQREAERKRVQRDKHRTSGIVPVGQEPPSERDTLSRPAIKSRAEQSRVNESKESRAELGDTSDIFTVDAIGEHGLLAHCLELILSIREGESPLDGIRYPAKWRNTMRDNLRDEWGDRLNFWLHTAPHDVCSAPNAVVAVTDWTAFDVATAAVNGAVEA